MKQTCLVSHPYLFKRSIVISTKHILAKATEKFRILLLYKCWKLSGREGNSSNSQNK